MPKPFPPLIFIVENINGYLDLMLIDVANLTNSLGMVVIL